MSIKSPGETYKLWPWLRLGKGNFTITYSGRQNIKIKLYYLSEELNPDQD